MNRRKARSKEGHISIKEAAIRMEKTQRDIRFLCRTGSLPGAYQKHKNGPWLIPLSAIEAFEELSSSKVPAIKNKWKPTLTKISFAGLFLFIFAMISALADYSTASEQLTMWGQNFGIGLPFPKATEDEILIIITNFSGDPNLGADTRIYKELKERIFESEIANVRIEKLDDQVPVIEDDARNIGQIYGASIVIWGMVDSAGYEPRYTVIRNKEYISSKPEVGITLATDLPTFSAYIVEGAPKEFEYLMLFSIGQISYFKEDYEQALVLFDKAVSVDLAQHAKELDIETIFYYRCFIYRSLEKIPEALEECNKALELNNSNDVFLSGRGNLYVTLGDNDLGIEDFNRAIEINPNQPLLYVNRANAYSNMEDFELALQDYNKAINLNPNESLIYNNRGVMYGKQKKYSEAIADFNYAIELEPDSPESYYNRGLYHDNMCNYESAIRDYTKAIENGWEHAIVFFQRGDAYYALENHTLAIEDYSYAIELDPNAPVIYNNRGNTYHALNELDIALTDFNQALELDSKYALAFYNRAAVYVDMGKSIDAIADFQRYLELAPPNDEYIESAKVQLELLSGISSP